MARKAAAQLRKRGQNLKDSRDQEAARYEISAEKLNAKISKFANKKNVNAGKAKIDEILKKAKSKGYDNSRANEEWRKEQDLREKMGDDRYEAYSKVRNKSLGLDD